MTNRRMFFGTTAGTLGALAFPLRAAAAPQETFSLGHTAVDYAITTYGMQGWASRIHRIAWGESRYVCDADNGVCAGLFQFTWGTWCANVHRIGVPSGRLRIRGGEHADTRYDPFANALLAVKLMSLDQWGHWRATDPYRF